MNGRHDREKIGLILSLYRAGKSYSVIAHAFAITRCVVAGVINRWATEEDRLAAKINRRKE